MVDSLPTFAIFATQVLLLGLPQRFCQQCGRFHPLSAFDGACKSCRKELEAHNKRRRKVGPAPPFAHAMPCAPPHVGQQRPRAAASLLALADAFDREQPAGVLEAPPACCAEHRAPRSARPAKRSRLAGADSPPPPTPPPADVTPGAPPLPPPPPPPLPLLQASPLPLLPFAGEAIAAALAAHAAQQGVGGAHPQNQLVGVLQALEASRQVNYLLSGGAPIPAALILLAPLLQAMALRAAQQQQATLAAPAVPWQGHLQQQPAAVLAALVAQSLFAGHALRQ